MPFHISLFSILFESNANIMALGFPEVIASLLSQKFGKNAFTIAKWVRENDSYKASTTNPDGTSSIRDDWWKVANRSYSFDNKIDLADLVEIYDAAKDSEEKYRAVMDRFGYKPTAEFNQTETLKFIKDNIIQNMFEKTFFSYETLVKDIQSGKLTDLKPYKDLSYQAAKDKYDKKRLFKDPGKVLKKYENGWRWIDSGSKCQLIGGLMKNCGSTGVMSMDEDRTMLTLFDSKNVPHIVATYSPNEKRLSSVEGVGGSDPKDKYHDYIFDITKHLGINFDYDKAKSKLLKLKGALWGQFQEIKPLKRLQYSEFFKVTMNDGSVYYTDSYSFTTAEDIKKTAEENFDNDLLKTIEAVYHSYSDINIKKINLYKFIQGER